jgi:bis(5'-adenosyl)-triphosphatase
MFSKFPIERQTVFLATELSFAFTNLRPVIPGHVLVSPIRIVDRLSLLTSEELGDLFTCARLVGDVLLRAHPHADSLTFTVQDGESAGQSVKHVHVHVMPRWATDRFNTSDIGNDAVYAAINRSDAEIARNGPKVDESNYITGRTKEQMIAEALGLRHFMEEILRSERSV